MRFPYKIRRRRSPNGQAGRRKSTAAGGQSEYELLDTGVFDGDRYFACSPEYAKARPSKNIL